MPLACVPSLGRPLSISHKRNGGCVRKVALFGQRGVTVANQGTIAHLLSRSQLIWYLSCSFKDFVNKASDNTCILIVGHDDLLLRTREWILRRWYSVQLAGDVATVSTLAASHSFRLVILCHTVTQEECRQITDLLIPRSPGVKILSLIAITGDGGTLECSSCTPSDRPEILIARVQRLLNPDSD